MLHKIASVLMAFLVLFSTLSFVVEKHFCGGTLVDVAVFSEVEGCGMEMPSSAKTSCCKDKVEIIKGQDELKFSFNDFDVNDSQFVAVFFHTFINLFEGLPEQVIPFKEYSPPNLIYDRQVLHNIFLI